MVLAIQLLQSTSSVTATVQGARNVAPLPQRVTDSLIANCQIPARLAAAERENPQHRRSLVIAHTKIGNALDKGGGDKSEALKHYRLARNIAEPIANENPTNAQARRDLSIVYGKLGMRPMKTCMRS